MYKKLFIFFIGGCLLIQLVSANAIAHTLKTDSPKEASPRDLFYLNVMDDFLVLWNSVLINGSTLLDDISKDVNKLETKSDGLQGNLSMIMSFVQNANKYKENSSDDAKLLGLSAEYANIFNVFVKAGEQEPDNKELDIFLKSFSKHGGEKFEEDVEDRFSEYFKKVSAKLEEYISNLSVEDKEKEAKLLKWYDEFKTEKDIPKQIHVFSSLFNTYNNKGE